jgi:hypothetical protein
MALNFQQNTLKFIKAFRLILWIISFIGIIYLTNIISSGTYYEPTGNENTGNLCSIVPININLLVVLIWYSIIIQVIAFCIFVAWMLHPKGLGCNHNINVEYKPKAAWAKILLVIIVLIILVCGWVVAIVYALALHKGSTTYTKKMCVVDDNKIIQCTLPIEITCISIKGSSIYNYSKVAIAFLWVGVFGSALFLEVIDFGCPTKYLKSKLVETARKISTDANNEKYGGNVKGGSSDDDSASSSYF